MHHISPTIPTLMLRNGTSVCSSENPHSTKIGWKLEHEKKYARKVAFYALSRRTTSWNGLYMLTTTTPWRVMCWRSSGRRCHSFFLDERRRTVFHLSRIGRMFLGYAAKGLALIPRRTMVR